MHVEDRQAPLLTADDVAERLQVRPATIRTWARRGVLPAVRLGTPARGRRSALTQARSTPRYGSPRRETASPLGALAAFRGRSTFCGRGRRRTVTRRLARPAARRAPRARGKPGADHTRAARRNDGRIASVINELRTPQAEAVRDFAPNLRRQQPE